MEKQNFYDLNFDHLKSFLIKEVGVDKKKASHEYGIKLIDSPKKVKYDVIILAVAHDEFKLLNLEKIKTFANKNYVLFDIKYILKDHEVDGRL